MSTVASTPTVPPRRKGAPPRKSPRPGAPKSGPTRRAPQRPQPAPTVVEETLPDAASPSSQPAGSARGGFAVAFVLIAAAMVFALLLGSSLYLNSLSAAKLSNAGATTSAIALLERHIAQTQSLALQTRDRRDVEPSVADIDTTLKALIDGGSVETEVGVKTLIEPAATDTARERAEAAAQTWKQARTALLSSHYTSGADDLTGPVIADLDALARETTAAADARIGLLQNVRNGITVGAILMLAAILFVLIRRVNSSRARAADYASTMETRNAEIVRASNDLAQSKAGTDLIMETVSQGLFLMGRDFKIDGQYSKELEAIFRVPELRAFNVLNLLQRVLTDRMFNTTKDYFALLFDETKKERTVLQVNPLQQVEVNFANSEGGYTSRYLNFAFRRIVTDGVVGRVFVAVNDITDRVELEQQLRLSEVAKERQFEFLLGVLHVAPTELDDFLTVAREQLSVMNTALRTQDFAAATAGQMTIFRQRLETVFRSVHTVKGHAQALKFNHFVNVCHQFESKLVSLRNRSVLGGDDFLAVVIAQSELAKDIDELSEVRARFVTVSAVAAAGKERRATDLLTTLADLVERTAEAQSKKARLETVGFEYSRLQDHMRRAIKDVLIQFARNSVTHGVEGPEERIGFGKTPMATVTIAAKLDAGAEMFAFTFRDDGRGLDPEAIKARALAKGLITAEEAAAMSKGAAVGLIFRPGFSTMDVATQDAGRGFGMNIIKEIVVDQLGGKLSMKSEPQRFTEFSVMIPLKAAVAAS